MVGLRLLRWPRPAASIMQRSGVRPSVCLSRIFSNVNRARGAYSTGGVPRDAASVYFRPSVTRTDILTYSEVCAMAYAIGPVSVTSRTSIKTDRWIKVPSAYPIHCVVREFELVCGT